MLQPKRFVSQFQSYILLLNSSVTDCYVTPMSVSWINCFGLVVEFTAYALL